jgi:HEPN domain-containing protein
LCISSSYLKWLQRANYNFELCNIEKFKDDKDAYPELCFNAHQATEKALKAFLVFLDIEPIKTHNLVLLTK